jgi:hypothetical protein
MRGNPRTVALTAATLHRALWEARDAGMHPRVLFFAPGVVISEAVQGYVADTVFEAAMRPGHWQVGES